MRKAATTETVTKTGPGAPVSRIEDERFLTGQGHFVADMALPDMAFAYVVRSPHAHARILGIDKSAALRAPGVLAVLTGEDVLEERIGALKCHAFPHLPEGSKHHRPLQPILATGKVRHVGDRVALIVAETLGQAIDAGELLGVNYEALPAVTLEDALATDAPRIWDDALNNISFELENGDRAVVDRKFSAAAHVTKLFSRYPRIAANPIEPRAAVAYFDAIDGRYTLCSTTQLPFASREIVAAALGIPELNLRVIAMDIGGSFGVKGPGYPEEVLTVWAAGKLRRPVKWTADRSESLSSDIHGRDQIAEAEMALNAAGRILALRVAVTINVGAYLGAYGGVPPDNTGRSYTLTYDVPLIHSVVRATFTNSCPLGPHRGSGKPEATLIIERLIDKAAREMGIDRIEIRRRNLIKPSALPYETPGGLTIDSGDFERILDKTLALADWQGFGARRADSERRGLRRGIGLGMHCHPSGSSQSERMEIRVAPDGSVALHAGTVATGQSHETMYTQMVSEWLGVPFDKVRVFQGDTDKILFGRGTFAQRCTVAGGSSLRLAADEVVRKGKAISAWMMEASEADIGFEEGKFRVQGTDRCVSFAEVARKSYQPMGLPGAFGIGLDGTGVHEGSYCMPNGCMICEVEVDPETGTVKVKSLSSVDDVGTVVNPITLEGQLHGSIAQGLGEALIEEIVYDRETGQLLSGSAFDLPRADDMPQIRSDHHTVPTKTNLLGVKGGSEAGNNAAPPAIINAIIDALLPLGVEDIPMPALPDKVWRAIRAGAANQDAA